MSAANRCCESDRERTFVDNAGNADRDAFWDEPEERRARVGEPLCGSAVRETDPDDCRLPVSGEKLGGTAAGPDGPPADPDRLGAEGANDAGTDMGRCR